MVVSVKKPLRWPFSDITLLRLVRFHVMPGLAFATRGRQIAIVSARVDLRRQQTAGDHAAPATLASGLDHARERLRLLNGHVRVGDKADQLVGGIASNQAFT